MVEARSWTKPLTTRDRAATKCVTNIDLSGRHARGIIRAGADRAPLPLRDRRVNRLPIQKSLPKSDCKESRKTAPGSPSCTRHLGEISAILGTMGGRPEPCFRQFDW